MANSIQYFNLYNNYNQIDFEGILPAGNSYQKVKWSTSVLKYKDINGLRLSTYGEAVWHFPEGDYVYGKAKLKNVEYNCK